MNLLCTAPDTPILRYAVAILEYDLVNSGVKEHDAKRTSGITNCHPVAHVSGLSLISTMGSRISRAENLVQLKKIELLPSQVEFRPKRTCLSTTHQ